MNACVRIVVLALAGCYSLSALGQDKAGKRDDLDDLDVTMQIIVDPNAQLPDEIVRRIPLPPARSPATTTPAAKASETKSRPADKGNERAQEARELGKDAAESARERARDAQEQREEARNSAKERERERNRDRGPPDRPNPPDRGPPPRN